MATLPGPRVLSIRQPWAWAIASGRKKVENRTWSTQYRGVVYIHASSAINRQAIEWLSRKARLRPPSELTRGAIIAVGELTDVVDRKRGARFGIWFEGPFGFVLQNVRPLHRPVPTKGKLGLFRPSSALVRSVTKQLGTRRALRGAAV